VTRNRYRLFLWLAIIGALSGYLLGESILGSGGGIYVAPVSAIVGLLLAWALQHTRPVNDPAPRIEPVDEPRPKPPPGRQRKTTSAVRVAKSQGGKRR
jgi:hypothetical protein